jgi:hypothetical protein
MMNPQNPELALLLKERYDIESLDELESLLKNKGTLTFVPLKTGLFSAALTTDYSQGTNYHAAWVRDNVHVAYAHLVTGQPQLAANVARALCRFFAKPSQKERFENLIANPSAKDDPGQQKRFNAMIADPSQKDRLGETMPRPHIRFNGDTLEEIMTQWWDHAQNDALGYFLWLYAQVILYPLGSSAASAPLIKPEEWENDLATLGLFVKYFQAIEYWKDPDGGHWEETRKISASSIGAVVAGLRKLRDWHVRAPDITAGYERRKIDVLHDYYYAEARTAFPKALLDDLISKGQDALERILPCECSEGKPKLRQFDSALLFLAFPLEVLEWPMADRIVSRTEKHLRGPIGIKRYLRDSFYCTNYEKLIAEQSEDPTRNFSEDIASRDAIFTPGGEAQWCLFDPILSVYYGRRYKISKSDADLSKQTEYLNRSLCQITKANPPRCAAFQCPELYYLEDEVWQTSKSTPLLWTQANLRTALTTMCESLKIQRVLPAQLAADD